MRNNILTFALTLVSFFFANQANAQMIVNDSTKTPGIQLVQMEDGDPILIVYNLSQMDLEQLEEAARQIEEDIESTDDMIRILTACNACNQDLYLQVQRNKKNEQMLIAVDLRANEVLLQGDKSIVKKN
ncbi:MAG: hypothetical protein ACK4FA_00195 [Candidatus Paceibacteria bacterium]